MARAGAGQFRVAGAHAPWRRPFRAGPVFPLILGTSAQKLHRFCFAESETRVRRATGARANTPVGSELERVRPRGSLRSWSGTSPSSPGTRPGRSGPNGEGTPPRTPQLETAYIPAYIDVHPPRASNIGTCRYTALESRMRTQNTQRRPIAPRRSPVQTPWRSPCPPRVILTGKGRECPGARRGSFSSRSGGGRWFGTRRAHGPGTASRSRAGCDNPAPRADHLMLGAGAPRWFPWAKSTPNSFRIASASASSTPSAMVW